MRLCVCISVSAGVCSKSVRERTSESVYVSLLANDEAYILQNASHEREMMLGPGSVHETRDGEGRRG